MTVSLEQAPQIMTLRAMRARLLSDPHRPTYHFVAPEGNCQPFDPDGAIYWNGRYHLGYMFQDERGHCWGHASSRDLLHWRWHPVALAPDPGDPEKGIYSGNVFINKRGEATALYHGAEAGNSIATSAEPQLDHWTKLPSNPIIPIPAKGSPESQLYSSWDPHGWLEGDTYYAVFGGKTPTIFKAHELDQWHYVGPLLSHDMPGVDDFEDVSCPDFFKLGDRHVLLCISHSRGCRYYVGRWENEQFHPEQHERMNWPGGTCFAPESLLDAKGRRIMWAWVIDPRVREEDGWCGTMSLPRVLSLEADGRMHIAPAEELQQLREHERRLSQLTVAADETLVVDGVSGDCLELELNIQPQAAERFGLLVRRSPDGAEQTVIEFDRAAQQVTIDVARASLEDVKYYTYCMIGGRDNPEVTAQTAPLALADGEPLKLRVFVDRSILEVFINGRQCLTQRIYPTRRDSLGVAVFSQGGSMVVESLAAWDMAPTNQW